MTNSSSRWEEPRIKTLSVNVGATFGSADVRKINQVYLFMLLFTILNILYVVQL